ncbi:MAG: serine/threonine protein kinase [Deltaproteobacteria bacterium]|nr:serine/threonine protein kinase [Deltaproteobacteria bacterium]
MRTEPDLQAALPERYELGKKLGAGGCGFVHAAFDRHMQRDVAIKFLELGTEDVGSVRKRFHREARALSLLRHQNVLCVYDYSGIDAPQPFLVCELVDGESVSDLVRRVGPLPAEKVAAIGHEALLALAEAHAAGLVHRDVAPGNIMVERSGRVVLMDFGVARAAAALLDKSGTFVGGATQVIGTPMYMSPEHINDVERLSAPSDLYSLGSVLVFAATGRHLFAGDNMLEVLANVVRCRHAPLEELLPPAAHGLIPVLAQCLVAELGARAQSAQRLAAELSTLLAGKDPRAILAASAGEAPAIEAPVFPGTQIATITTAPPPARVSPIMWTIAGGLVAATSAIAIVLFLKVAPSGPAPATLPPRTLPPATLPPPDPAPEAPPEIPDPPRDAAKPIAPKKGELRILVQPYGVIYADGERLGMTPEVEVLKLAPGRHQVRIEHPKFDPIYRTVEIAAGRRQTLRVEFAQE